MEIGNENQRAVFSCFFFSPVPADSFLLSSFLFSRGENEEKKGGRNRKRRKGGRGRGQQGKGFQALLCVCPLSYFLFLSLFVSLFFALFSSFFFFSLFPSFPFSSSFLFS